MKGIGGERKGKGRSRKKREGESSILSICLLLRLQTSLPTTARPSHSPHLSPLLRHSLITPLLLLHHIFVTSLPLRYHSLISPPLPYHSIITPLLLLHHLYHFLITRLQTPSPPLPLLTTPYLRLHHKSSTTHTGPPRLHHSLILIFHVLLFGNLEQRRSLLHQAGAEPSISADTSTSDLHYLYLLLHLLHLLSFHSISFFLFSVISYFLFL